MRPERPLHRHSVIGEWVISLLHVLILIADSALQMCGFATQSTGFSRSPQAAIHQQGAKLYGLGALNSTDSLLRRDSMPDNSCQHHPHDLPGDQAGRQNKPYAD